MSTAAGAAFDLIVLGGGAAGLMSALTAGRLGLRVLVLEHAERCGKKILMSGGGRCNFTNTGTTPAQFLSQNPHFCKSALARFKPSDFIDMVDAHKIAWHEKELGQLFCDVSSKQIVAMLLDECAQAKVEIRTGCTIESVAHSDNAFGVETSIGKYRAERLIVATGGLSIPRMGATGIGYRIAESFGHTVLPTRAGLVPLTLSGKPLEQLTDLAGVSLPVDIQCGKQSFSNALLITHRGLSGPAVLQISSYWREGMPLVANLLPDTDVSELLAQWRAERPDAHIQTLLSEVIPKRFAQRLCDVWIGNAPIKQMHAKQLTEAAQCLRAWPITASGTEGYRTAEVTLGGVDTKELSSATMMSKHVPGLYFVGEVVDVTGWLGGYNFQWAWASGHAAGSAAALPL